MKVTRLVALLMALLAVLGVATPISAHDEFRLVGSLTKVDAAKGVISVKFTETDGPEKGKVLTVPVKLTGETVITRDKKSIPRTELKVGLNVVVDALGDTYDDLEALEIRVVPPPARGAVGATPQEGAAEIAIRLEPSERHAVSIARSVRRRDRWG